MLRARIIPCLLIKDKGLVKTINFLNHKYVGDPINAVRIFNEKEADELMVLDIDATVKGLPPNYSMIEHLAAECRMPLCYGGGVRTIEQARRVLQLGVEKIAISSAAIENPDFVAAFAEEMGRQSVVVVLDVKKKTKTGEYDLYIHNGRKRVSMDFLEMASLMEAKGAGEIVVNAIDQDGKMNGYDMDLVAKIREVIRIPLTVLGGAGHLDDLKKLVKQYGIIGAAAGSLFVFKGIYRAVLINYPSHEQKELLIGS